MFYVVLYGLGYAFSFSTFAGVVCWFVSVKALEQDLVFFLSLCSFLVVLRFVLWPGLYILLFILRGNGVSVVAVQVV